MFSKTVPRRRLTFARLAAAIVLAAALSPALIGHNARASEAPAGAGPSAARTLIPSLSPDDIRRAYALPKTGAPGQTIAVVVAYNDRYAQKDLNAYSEVYSVPPCTVRNGCLRILNEHGSPAPLPGAAPTGDTWTAKASIGIELARGICHSCKVMLVEANTAGIDDLSKAVGAAAAKGATVIETSFAVSDSQQLDASDGRYYSRAHAVVVAAVGEGAANDGYGGGVNFPSALGSVLAVGGTELKLGDTGPWVGERAWSDSVSGCSLYQAAPGWQAAEARAVGCQGRRSVADLAAMAEPGTAIHITGIGVPGGPWYSASQTSVSASIIAATIGLAGSMGSREAQTLYAHARSDPGAFHHILGGENATNCSSPICMAGPGYNGPTGLGTPFGLAAFLKSGGALTSAHPQVGLPSRSARLRPDGHGEVRFRALNGNPFAISGPVTLTATLDVGGRPETVTLARGHVKLGPLAGVTVTLTMASKYRAALARGGTGRLLFRARGPVPPTVSVARPVTVS